MRFFLVFFALFSSANISAARLDAETRESIRCAKYFKYFEDKYDIPRDTLHSIALQESGKTHSKRNIRMVWPWSVNVEGKTNYFDNQYQALAFAKEQYNSGKSIDVGCMQVNMRYHADRFKTMRHALNPKHNIAYAAQFLREKFDKTGDWHKAIGLYHSGTHILGSKYKKNVLTIADNIEKYKTIYKKQSKPKIKRTKAKSSYWSARKRKTQQFSLSHALTNDNNS